jgi:phosphoglycolate phosphatase
MELVPSAGFSMQEYWELKRSKNNHKKILTGIFKYTEEAFCEFEKEWLNKIELPEYLQYDTPIDGVFDVLDYLLQKHTLYIVTARQEKDNLLTQIDSCKLNKYFTKIFATENKFNKEDVIRTLGYEADDIITGDTGHDVQTGYSLGITTIAVTYGFLKREVLETYGPHFMIDRLQDIKMIV